MTTRYLVTAVDESSDDGMQTWPRRVYLEEALEALGVWPSTDADAVEAIDAAVYDAHHVEWELERERNDLRDEVKRLRTALREISTLEGADPDGIVWTWKQLFCKAEDIAKQALEVDG